VTEEEGGVRVPPSFYEPLPPPAPKSYTKVIVIGAVAFGLVVLVAIVGGALSLRDSIRRDALEKRQAVLADKALDDALERPADTAKVSPSPDGTKRWLSDGDGRMHTYGITLPRGWEARRVAARENEDSFSDSVLTRTGSSTAVVIDRFDFDAALEDEEFERALRAGLTDETTHVTSAYTETTVGVLRETAYYLDAENRDADGVLRLRVVVFQHGGQKYRFDFAAKPATWGRMLKEFTAILASLRWGE
jgi:hypothetical protein